MRKAILVMIVVACFGCKPSDVEKPMSYNQPFVSDVAFLVIEWGGKPQVMASGFLADKDDGEFFTAKHFSDGLKEMEIDSFKLFFNGKVYDAELAQVSYVHDVTVVRITSPFLPEDFPDPSPVARQRPKPGETVYIRGFHPHAYRVRQENKSDGFPDVVIGVLRDYYRFFTQDPRKESQIVFHNLESEVVPHDPNPLFKDALQYENESFIKVLMARDHKISFGGLSGGMVVNEDGEWVGIITAQDIYRFEYGDDGMLVNPRSIRRVTNQLFDTIYVTPVENFLDLYEYTLR